MRKFLKSFVTVIMITVFQSLFLFYAFENFEDRVNSSIDPSIDYQRAVNDPPISWPTETIGPGGWYVYTQLGSEIKDLTGNPDCSRGASISGSNDISRGDSPYYASCFYSYDSENKVFFYRVRVAGDPLTPQARSSGVGTGTAPFANNTWNLLVDLDGDGFKEINIVLAGDSGGAKSTDISVIQGSNDGDDLKIYYNNLNTQCVTSEVISNNQVVTPNDLVWWGNTATKSATVPPNPQVDGAQWDFGRTRVVYHTASNGVWGSGYFIDFQFKLANCTDSYNSGNGGNQLWTHHTPVSFGYTTSSSNSDPLQKDFASSYCYSPSCSMRFPYSDIITLEGENNGTPKVGPLFLNSINCPSSVVVKVLIADTLAVNPPSSGTGVVVDTISSVTFQYYYDFNNNGLPDDNFEWTNMAVIGSSLNPDTRGDLAPDGISGSFNDWGVIWNTNSLFDGTYLIRVIAVDDQNNTTTKIVGSYHRENNNCYKDLNLTWKSYVNQERTIESDNFPLNSTIYMLGSFDQITNYNIAFYDPQGLLVKVTQKLSDPFGNLEDEIFLGSNSLNGLYHSMVYPQNFVPPSVYNGTYNPLTNPFLANDIFYVGDNIPNPPILNGPIIEGQTTISGSSDALNGSIVTVYIDGVEYYGVVLNGEFEVAVPPLQGGQVVYATVTLNGQTSNPSGSLTAKFIAPTVNSPIFSNDTSISGYSESQPGTVINVYLNGVVFGTAVVQGNGSWVLSNIPNLNVGDVVTATAGNGETQSDSSTPVVVQQFVNQSNPPIVSSPIIAGGNVTISGSSIEPPGTIITVYVDGNPIGTATVTEDGTWSLSGVTLVDGQLIYATAQATQESVSPPSNQVYVSLNTGSDLTPPPVISGPIYGESTSVSGSSLPNARVDIYLNGIYLGFTIANGEGEWVLSGIAPLMEGTIVSATATLSPMGTSIWSNPLVVGGIVHLLRSDKVTSLVSYNGANIFKRRFPNRPALEPLGINHRYDEGEGELLGGNGSSDDDDFYLRDVHSPVVDPDPTVLNDINRPLVFYELIDNGANERTIFLSKEGGVITITFIP